MSETCKRVCTEHENKTIGYRFFLVYSWTHFQVGHKFTIYAHCLTARDAFERVVNELRGVIHEKGA